MKSRNMSLDEDPLLSLIDKVVVCDQCNHIQILSADSEVVLEPKIELDLHTLNHGTIKFFVQDVQYHYGAFLRFDELSHRIFCISKDHAIHRELLDAWIFDVCGMGLNFRESIFSRKGKASSLNYNLFWIQKVASLNRRIANDSLNEFMKT